MLLQVNIEGEAYLADVGFGAMTLTGPLLLETDKTQQTPHEPYRIFEKKEYYLMQAKVRDNWKTLYRFILQEQFLVDYEVFNWYLSKHPQSGFITDLMAARPDQNRRYTLNNNKFKIHHLNGNTTRKILASLTEIRTVLNNEFQLKLPETDRLDTTLKRLITKEKTV